MSEEHGSSHTRLDDTRTLKTATACLQSLESASSDQWIAVFAEHKPRSGRMQWFKHKDDKTTFKAVIVTKDTGDTLSDWKALLETNGMDTLWDQRVKSRSVLCRPDKHTQICETEMKESWDQGPCQFRWIKHINHTRSSLRYVAASDPFYLWYAFDIRLAPTDEARVLFYFQLDRRPISPPSWLELYVMSLATLPQAIVASHGRPPRLCRYDVGLTIDRVDYYPNDRTFQLTYDYSSQETVPLSSSVESITIHQRQPVREHPRVWHSGSWERDNSNLRMASMHKSSFMSMSPHLYPSLYSPRPQKHIATSFPEVKKPTTGWRTEGKDSSAQEEDAAHLEIDIDGDTWAAGSQVDLQLEVEIFDDNTSSHKDELNDRFAHLCVRCYRRSPNTNRYLVVLSHPPNLMQYLCRKEALDSLDDHSDPNSALVKLTLHPNLHEGKSFRLLLNGKDWPIRPWSARTWSKEESDASEDEDNKDDLHVDDDIFTEDMEGVDQPNRTRTDMQLSAQQGSQNPAPPKVLVTPSQAGCSSPARPLEEVQTKNKDVSGDNASLKHSVAETKSVPDSGSEPIGLVSDATHPNARGWNSSSLFGRLSQQVSTAVQQAQQFFTRYDAPPHLEALTCGKVNETTCDSSTRVWRCEYWRPKESAMDAATNTRAEIRLDRCRWSNDGKYSVVVDPPPYSVCVTERTDDPFGLWVAIEHNEDYIIPQQGKILVIVKPGDSESSSGVTINGIPQNVEKGKEAETSEDESRRLQLTANSTLPDGKAENEAVAGTAGKDTLEKVSPGEITEVQAIATLPTPPTKQGEAALLFLKRMDKQFEWTIMSDKNGLRLSKRAGIKRHNNTTPEAKGVPVSSTSASPTPIYKTSFEGQELAIPEPYTVYKATKVIENFSLEEVTAMVTDVGHLRETYDETVERVEVVEHVQRGCKVVRQIIKSMFPFKSRELYLSSCIAHEKVSSDTDPFAKRIFHVETSLSGFPALKKNKLPRGHQFISGWILEGIDPYTTAINHPIPSMCATYVTALDLGTSAPSYVSNLVASESTKKIQSIETYLKKHGPPPFASLPQQVFGWINQQTVDVHMVDGDQEFIVWNQAKTNYSHQKRQLQFDGQFSLPRQESLTYTPPLMKSTGATSARSLGSLLSPSPLNQRRSSLATSPPAPEIIERRPSSSSTSKRKSIVVDSSEITLSHVVLDLQSYPKGYELDIRLFRVDHQNQKDVSNLLSLQAVELTPGPSHQIVEKAQPKHAIKVTAQSLQLLGKRKAGELYELRWTLLPARETFCQQRGMRLTVSGVLGEEDTSWQGVILVNGKQIDLGSKTVILPQEIEAETIRPPQLNNANTIEASRLEETLDQEAVSPGTHVEAERAPYMGVGMMAAAFDGVNDLRERMMMPFRVASQSFLSSYSDEENLQEATMEEEDRPREDKGRDDVDNHGQVATTEIEQAKLQDRDGHSRAVSSMNGFFKKGFLVILVLLCLGVVLALLLIPPLIRRWSTSPEVVVIPESVGMVPFGKTEGMTMRSLLRLPSLWGWELQLVAVRHHQPHHLAV